MRALRYLRATLAGFAAGFLTARFAAVDDLLVGRMLDDFATGDFGRTTLEPADRAVEERAVEGLAVADFADGLALEDRAVEGFVEDLATRPLLTVVCFFVLRVLRALREPRALRARALRSGRFHPIARSARNREGIWSTPSP